MHSIEPKVSPISDYYLYQPSLIAYKLYLYPLVTGCFYYEAGYHLVRNHYDSFLLMHIVKGSCRIRLASHTYLAEKDQVVLLDCYQPHSYSFPVDTQVNWIHFDGLLARNYFELITTAQGPVCSLQNVYAFARPLGKILELFRTAAPIKESKVSGYITQMLTELLSSQPETKATATASQIVENSLAYINEHFSEPLSLGQMAQNANLSPYYFTRVFTAETGFSPHQYLIATRINSAKYLLDNTKIPVKDIAFSSGFNSESSFCITFKKWEHMTPSDYRNRSSSGSTE